MKIPTLKEIFFQELGCQLGTTVFKRFKRYYKKFGTAHGFDASIIATAQAPVIPMVHTPFLAEKRTFLDKLKSFWYNLLR